MSFNSVQLFYSLYIVYVITGLFLLRSEDSVIQTKDMILTYAVLMLITMREYTEDERQMIESTWVIVGVICTYYALFSTKVINKYESRAVVYIMGYNEDPNQFCAYFIMPTMVCIKRIIEKRKAMLFYMVLLILILYSVLRTGSRGGMIGIVAGIFMCLLFATKNIKAKIGLIFASGLVFLVVIFLVFPLLPEDVQQRYSIASVLNDRAAGRFNLWIYLVNYAFEEPVRLVFGSGLLSTYSILENSNIANGSGAAHNQFIQVLTDQGMVGLVLFFLVICTCFFRNIKKQPYYSCAFVSIMAFSMSLTMYVFKPYINIIMMCAMTFINTDKNLKAVPEKSVSDEYILSNKSGGK